MPLTSHSFQGGLGGGLLGVLLGPPDPARELLAVHHRRHLEGPLARRGTVVIYEVASEEGPPHERTFEVAAMVDGEELARGSGRSKKDAEQAAAETALEGMSGP